MAHTATGQTYTYGYDVHGSVSLLLKPDGTVYASYAYRPYGEEDIELSKGDTSKESPFNPMRYSAKRFDSGSGSFDMEARRFSPDTAHFLQLDVYAGALKDLGLSLDPLTQNRYALAGGNPISYVEVDGHVPVLVAVAAALLAAAEAGLTAYDAYNTAQTLLNPEASEEEKALSLGASR